MSVRFSPNAITSSVLPKNLKLTPRPSSLRHATNANDRLRVAVLGGGITGLTTAYRLAEDPSTDVTIYEKSSRLGGWLSSERIEVEGGSVLFEWGPRTLRAGASSAPMATAELVCLVRCGSGLFTDVMFGLAARPRLERQHPPYK